MATITISSFPFRLTANDVQHTVWRSGSIWRLCKNCERCMNEQQLVCRRWSIKWGIFISFISAADLKGPQRNLHVTVNVEVAGSCSQTVKIVAFGFHVTRRLISTATFEQKAWRHEVLKEHLQGRWCLTRRCLSVLHHGSCRIKLVLQFGDVSLSRKGVE